MKENFVLLKYLKFSKSSVSLSVLLYYYYYERSLVNDIISASLNKIISEISFSVVLHASLSDCLNEKLPPKPIFKTCRFI